jgi:tetratricopeptide (TPR) repeat protein
MNKIGQNNAGLEQRENISAAHGVKLLLKRQSVFLYLVGAGFVLAALSIVFYALKTNRANEQASRLLTIAQTPKQFEELFKQYPKSPAAPAALLALASACFSGGDYDAAAAHYDEFIAKYPRHSMLSAAELGKVMCSEARGEMGKALAGFDAFLLAYPGSYLTPQALFGKARCLQAEGKLPEARIVYENFIAAYPESKWRQQAEAALQSLDRQMRLNRKSDNPKASGG